MKKIIQLFLLLILISLVGGCSKSEVENPPDIGKSELPLNNAQVLEDIKKLIQTDLEIKLPQELPLTESEYLTAVIKSDKNSYSVVFYKNNDPMQLNSEALINGSSSATEIANLQVVKERRL